MSLALELCDLNHLDFTQQFMSHCPLPVSIVYSLKFLQLD